MASESSKTNETQVDLDLEDGEIESDNEETEVIIVDDTNNVSKNAKTDAIMSPSLSQKSRDSATYLDAKDKAVDDDWMGDVENAIAMALIKDGIDPPLPKLQARSNNDNGKKSSDPEHQSSKLKKRKRRRLEKDLARKEELKKKLKLAEEQLDGKSSQDQSDEMLDEYEMLCVRGGSPPPISQQSIASKNPNCRLDDEPYYSDDSYSSYDSYEERIQKRRAKDRRTGRSKRDNKRRRDDSDDDRHEKRGPRKLELCKFYLMECCAKRDKCLYLHGDFPCKYYYLGMKNHDQDNCKFSHGKPLSDQMRNILLKHLETAPKEILGDFPRLKTETAHNMLSVQHQKLLKEFGMEVPAMNASNNSNPRIPSLMEVPTKQPKINIDSLQQLQKHLDKNQHEQYNEQFNKKDSNDLSSLALSPATKPKMGKARKTRWCDTGPPAISQQQQQQLIQKKLLSHQSGNSNLPKVNSNINATGAESYLSLKYLNGVITTEQIEKLSSIGIENVDQMNQLTVAQLNELGLSVAQISEIQLNALNMQKLGLAKKPSTITTFSSSQVSNVSHNDDTEIAASSIGSDIFDFGVGGKDLDMRISQVASIASVSSSQSTSCSQDVDMRVLPTQPPSTNPALPAKADESRTVSPIQIATIASPDHQPIQSQSNVVTALLPPVPPLTSSPVMSMLTKAQNNTNATHTSMFSELGSTENQQPGIIDYTRFLNKSQTEPQNRVDYSQYLKDSNLDLEKTNLEDLNNDEVADDDDDADETNNLVVIEDEPTLQIDESWCSNDDEDSQGDTNHEDTNIYDEMDICNEESTNSSPKSGVTRLIQDTRSTKENVSEANTSLPISVNLNVLSHPRRFDKYASVDSSLNNQSPLPAIFDKFTVPSGKMDKINVSKYLSHHDQDNQKTDEEDDDYETMSSGIDDALTDYIVGVDRRATCVPRKNLSSIVEKVTKELQNKQQPFEFFTRHIPETSHPTPESLDINSEAASASKHRSIYESSRSPIQTDDNSVVSTTKDKDMRLSSLFLDDMPNGDVDFRLPFKPANFLPATEIDGSEASHAHIEYKVHEVDVPKPDFTEIRRSINQSFDDILDPRLRKIFSLRTNELTKFSSPETPPPNTSKSEQTADFSAKQRIDPRRRNTNETTANETSNALNVATTSSHIDIQTILQTSDWYKSLSSKQKIMSNQQLAHLSGAMKKFHSDSTPNKIFDLSIVMQNPLLGQVLTNLGIYIDENGQFVKFSQTNQQSQMQQQLGNNMEFGGIGSIGNMGMGVDMMNLPAVVGNVIGQDFNQPQMGTGMLQQQPPSGMGRFMGPAGMQMPLRVPAPNFMADVRPGLLGLAPGIPYNIFDGQRHSGPANVNCQMFDINQGSGGGGSGYEHNFSNFDVNENGRFPGRFEQMQSDRRNRMENDRWPSRGGRNCGNNRNNQNSLRRNINYDRRPKKN